MRGYPKHLNNWDDYLYVKAHFPKTEWEGDFKALLNTKEWFNVGEVDGEGVTDDTHKVVADEQIGKKYQYELKENLNAKIFRMGHTTEEVEKILAEA